MKKTLSARNSMPKQWNYALANFEPLVHIDADYWARTPKDIYYYSHVNP